MSDYWALIAIGFAGGVLLGLYAASAMVERWFDAEDRDYQYFQLLAEEYWAVPIALVLVLVGAAYNAHTWRGFLHLAGMPMGWLLIGRLIVTSGARVLLAISSKAKWSERRTRRVMTTIGVLVFAALALAPGFLDGGCDETKSYCE